MPDLKNTVRFQHMIISALAIGTLSLFCFQSNAIAETRYLASINGFNNQTPVDFSLAFSQKSMDLHSNNTTYPTRQRRISANLFNTAIPNLNIGLIIGSNSINQGNDDATAGLSLNGNHIGFAINGFFGDELQLGIYAQYIYQETRGENTLRTVSLTWHEWLTEATLRLSPGAHWAIIAGGGLMGLDADREVSGDLNETTRMKLANSFQGKLAVEMLTAPADRIRLTLYRGAFNGMQLSFAHTF